MIKLIEKQLNKILPLELTNDLLSSYIDVKDNFRKEKFPDVLTKSGRYAENIFRVLHYLNTKTVISEVKDMTSIEKGLSQNTKLSESVRLIIPRVTRSVIYTLRSKKDSVHVKENTPDLIDAALTMTATNWVLAELLRETPSKEDTDIAKVIKGLMKRDYSLMQTFEGQKAITKKLGCDSEILLVLLDSSQTGMNRKQIGESLTTYAGPTVTNSLKKLVSERKIFRAKSDKYYITDAGEKIVSEIILST